MAACPDIVCFGQQAWHQCWVTKQHLMSRLAQRGHRILYVDPAGDDAESLAFTGVREVQQNLWVFASPTKGLPLHGDHALRQASLAIAARRLGMRDPIRFVLIPQHPWRRIGVPAAATIYFAEDEWTAFSGYTDAQRRAMRQREEQLLLTCDVALAVSPRLVERFTAIQPHSYLQENAVDAAHFAAGAHGGQDAALAGIPRPRLGFVGQIDDRLDGPLLRQLAQRRPGWHLVLVGRVKSGTDLSFAEGLPNVHFAGYRSYDALPGVMRTLDVGLAPYRRAALTEACNPLKIYEYLAAGLPVVTTALPGLGSVRPVVATGESVSEYEAAIEHALCNPAVGRSERIHVARENDWEARVDLLQLRIAQARRLGGLRRALNRRQGMKHPVPLDQKEEAVRRLRPPRRADALVGPALRAVFAFGAAAHGGRRARRALQGRNEAVASVLVARGGALGDLVAALPQLEALREHYPDARIVLAVPPGSAGAARALTTAYVDEVRVLDWLSSRSIMRSVGGAIRLFLEGFDALVTGHSYFLHTAAFACGSPIRAGVDDGDRRQRWLNQRALFRPDRHEVDSNLAAIEGLCGAPREAASPPRLRHASVALRQTWSAVRDRLGLPHDYILIHPGSKRLSRRWPVERFSELINRLLADDHRLRIVISAGHEEAAIVNDVVGGLHPSVRSRVHSAPGGTSLKELMAIVQHARLVISNDTGVMHLAHALERPLLALLGPENDRRWGPYPWSTALTVALRHQVPCAPCDRFHCPSLYCMRSLSVDEVVNAAASLLATEDVAAGALRPVEQRTHVHGWNDLAASGLTLPSVAAVLDMRQSPSLETVERFRHSLATSIYPIAEAIVLTSAPSNVPSNPVGESAIRMVCCHPTNTSAWQAVLHTTSAPLLAVFDAEPSHPERLAEDVASLMRSAAAVAAAGRYVLREDQLPAAVTDCHGWTVRRVAIKARLGLDDSSTASSPLQRLTITAEPKRAAATV